MSMVLLYVRLATYDDTSAACAEGLFDPLIAVDDTTRGEVWRLDILHQLIDRDLTTGIYVSDTSIERLSKVVRSHIGRHTDGDTSSAIDQKVRNATG